jgi:dTDP-4-amino-4,6-dideoxygalactose transaminase
MPDTAAFQAGDAPIEFIDLGAQRRRLGRRVDEAILRVVDHGKYIMGPEVAIFEQELAAFCGAKHVLSCANGTDALGLALMAKGIKSGQAVLVPSFTFAATAEVVAWFDAVPVFVDVLEHTFNMDPVSLEAGIATARRLGLEPAGIIPVDLFGLPAAYDEILAIAAEHGLWVICDAAQSFGAVYKCRKIGTLGDITTTSFFPAKPLGCYGDGGAVFTDDDDIAAVLKSLRVHGQGGDKYDNVRIGMNARLDTMQAAVLSQKLSIFADEIEARNQVAARYNERLEHLVKIPRTPVGLRSVWAQYTLRIQNHCGRDAAAAELKKAGVPTAVYYAKGLHRQTAYRDYPAAGNGLPVSDSLSAEVLSLPMHPYLDESTQDRIVEALHTVLQG